MAHRPAPLISARPRKKLLTSSHAADILIVTGRNGARRRVAEGDGTTVYGRGGVAQAAGTHDRAGWPTGNGVQVEARRLEVPKGIADARQGLPMVARAMRMLGQVAQGEPAAESAKTGERGVEWRTVVPDGRGNAPSQRQGSSRWVTGDRRTRCERFAVIGDG